MQRGDRKFFMDRRGGDNYNTLYGCKTDQLINASNKQNLKV